MALVQPGTDQADKAAAVALNLGVDFNRTLIALWLHESVAVVSAGHQLDVELNKLFLAARSRKFSWEDWSLEGQRNGLWNGSLKRCGQNLASRMFLLVLCYVVRVVPRFPLWTVVRSWCDA